MIVSAYIMKKLKQMKQDEEHKSLDSVIRTLLKEYKKVE